MDAPRLHVVGVKPDDVRTSDEMHAGVLHNSAAEMPTDEQVLDTLVVHNGILVRVAATLNITEEYVMGVVSRNLGALSRKLRGRVMLSSFVTVLKLDAVLQASADELPLDTLGRTYAASLTAFSGLAGQFEEKEATDENDDADAAKQGMLDRLERMGKREEAARALDEQESAG